MGFYAWLGLGETILKLTSVFILSHITHYDKLITYGCLLLFSQFNRALSLCVIH